MDAVILLVLLLVAVLAWQIVRELKALRATLVAASSVYIRRDEELKATLAER